MPTSIELRQERARVVESLRAITNTAEAENRDLSAEERESYDRHETEFRTLGERIDRIETQEQREAEQAEPLNPNPDLPGGGDPSAEERSRQHRAAFAQFLRGGRDRLAPEQRALVENSDGEILVPEELEAEIYRATPTLAVIRPLVGKRPTQSNRVRRRSLDEVTVGWGKLETGTALTDSMPATPDEDFTYVEDLYGLAKIGEDELDDTDVNLEAFIRDSFAQAIAETEDTGFTIGTGHANQQPVGFMTAGGGIPTVAGTDTDYSGANEGVKLIDDLKKLIYATPAQYRRNGAFAMTSSTELFLSTAKDLDGRHYWEPNTQAGRPNTFLGYGIHNQEDIAAIATASRIAVFGDFARGYRILDRQGMTLKRLEELYAEDGMIGFKVRFRVGGDVVRPDAFRILLTL